MRLSLALCAVLVGFAFEASAATLYRWMDPDGREAIGTNPPPGVQAVPWTPGEPESAPSPAPAGAAPAPVPEAAPAAQPLSRRPTAEAEAKRERCARLRKEVGELRGSIEKKEAEIVALETRIEQLEASEVAYSRVDCRNDTSAGDQHCSPRIFDRDQEIAKVETSMSNARDQLDDLEHRANVLTSQHDCEEPAGHER